MYLFTEEDYNNAKFRDLLPCKCDGCGKEFLKKKTTIYIAKRDGFTHTFCSKECQSVLLTKQVLVTCTTCGKEFYKRNKEVKKSKSGNHFCSRSCAATYNNSHREFKQEWKDKTSQTLRDSYKERTGFSSCKEKKLMTIICSVCGQPKGLCKHPDICKNQALIKKTDTLKNLGFDFSKWGTKEVYDEWFRIKELLTNEYKSCESVSLIQQKYKIKFHLSLILLFRSMGIEYDSKLSDKDFENKTKYKQKCEFKFKVDEYPQLEGYELYEKYGMYSLSNKDGMNRDHIISKEYGWEHNIPPEVISHPANCRFISQKFNCMKNSSCDLTIEELYDRISLWESGLELPKTRNKVEEYYNSFIQE